MVALSVLSGGVTYFLQGLRALGVPIDAAPFTYSYVGERPTAGREASAQPLGRPPAAPPGEGGYAFLLTDAGQPVTYDPCRPIHYVVRSHGESEQMRRAVHDAIASAGAASGLTFVDDGFTLEAPSDRRDSYQPRRYGQRWAPVLIAFTDSAEVDGLGTEAIGLGGSTAVPRGQLDERRTYVSGIVYLDTPALMNYAASDQYALTRNVTQHEVGHLLGLDHVDTKGEIMRPSASKAEAYGPGDRRGLAALGGGSCAPEL